MKIVHPGDVLDSSEPFVHVLIETMKGKVCDNCCKERANLKRCSICKIMYYCNKHCQINDWKNAHKFECKIYSENENAQALLTSNSAFLRLVFRIHLMFKNNPDLAYVRYPTYDNGFRCFNDLMDHSFEVYSGEWPLFNKVSQNMHLMNLCFDSKQLISNIGKTLCNCFGIVDHYLNRVAVGIYISASVFDHSCKPNCDVIFNGSKLQVKVMEKFDLDKTLPTIAYIDLKKKKKERRMLLKERYCFKCHCSRCSSQEEEFIHTLNQMNGHLDYLVSEKKWKKAYQLGLKTLRFYKKIYPTYHSELTLRLTRVTEFLLNSNPTPSPEEFNALMIKLNQSVLVTHGKKHPFTKEIVRNLEKKYYEKKKEKTKQKAEKEAKDLELAKKLEEERKLEELKEQKEKLRQTKLKGKKGKGKGGKETKFSKKKTELKKSKEFKLPKDFNEPKPSTSKQE